MTVKPEEKQAFMHLTQAVGLLMENDYKGTITYLNNARHAVERLDTEQRNAEMYEEAKRLLKEVDRQGDLEMRRHRF
ncbi:hypothetical protein [Lentibacillus amyloliquefaciens]|uniref:Uncharacterized protein n=1 Tax=Lentibacillus amyloliquefaciens TaxID=1472767 RepID=A0A0U4FC61_9BACI|nr:hypothetical protein [Lentibacillus amyloliquefaciens]ALX50435.1 hypothetical protein AOX59_18730 [Lentibacillus amyloliquefaciens]